MKKYYKIFLSLLITLPFISASKRLPEVYSRSYKDYVLVYQRYEYVGDEVYYFYKIHNTADGYISSIEIDDGGFYNSVDADEYFDLFKNAVFGPDFNQEITFKSKSYYLDKPEKPRSYAYAYLKDNAATISGSKMVSQYSVGKDYYLYNIDLSIDNTNQKYDYAAIVKLNYEAETYYIKIDQRGAFQFATTEELDLAKLVVNDVNIVSSERSRNDPAIYASMMGLLLMIIFFGIVPIGIFSAIFFPKLARRRRARLREAKGS